MQRAKNTEQIASFIFNEIIVDGINREFQKHIYQERASSKRKIFTAASIENLITKIGSMNFGRPTFRIF